MSQFFENIEYKLYIKLTKIKTGLMPSEWQVRFANDMIARYERFWIAPNGEWNENVTSPIWTEKQRQTIREIVDPALGSMR